jgi:ATP-dependent Clp protease ATP-binding subunit ClpA
MIDELLFYNKNYFDFYKELKSKEGKEIISITKSLRDFDNASEINEYSQIVDISSLAGINNIQYNSESVFPQFPQETIFIADNKFKKLFEHELRFCFEEFKDLEIVEDFEVIDEEEVTAKRKKLKHKKIIDLSNDEISEFSNSFANKIYGHDKFKAEFEELIRNFRVFNKLGEHKILSIFLMGDSGVGKTEVARAIHKSLKGKEKLAKINFGNYSSDNSLNSLIGSPRGYIGSDEGEIFIRVKGSDTGIILIDEFEKSNATLFNYFLDVLENGKIVSSLAEEIDLNGFIIIFTSNVSKEDFPKRISPELRSRFDYKGFFTLLSTKDKKKFVEFRVRDIIKKFNKSYSKELPEELNEIVCNQIKVRQFKNMRELNKSIKDTFVKCVMIYTAEDE